MVKKAKSPQEHVDALVVELKGITEGFNQLERKHLQRVSDLEGSIIYRYGVNPGDFIAIRKHGKSDTTYMRVNYITVLDEGRLRITGIKTTAAGFMLKSKSLSAVIIDRVDELTVMLLPTVDEYVFKRMSKGKNKHPEYVSALTHNKNAVVLGWTELLETALTVPLERAGQLRSLYPQLPSPLPKESQK